MVWAPMRVSICLWGWPWIWHGMCTSVKREAISFAKSLLQVKFVAVFGKNQVDTVFIFCFSGVVTTFLQRTGGYLGIVISNGGSIFGTANANTVDTISSSGWFLVCDILPVVRDSFVAKV